MSFPFTSPVADPSRRPKPSAPDYRIYQRQVAEEKQSQRQNITHYYATTDLRSAFESNTNRAIQRNAVLKRFQALRAAETGRDTKLRRERHVLQQQILADEEKYRAELIAAESTKEGRLQQMRARVAELKSRREEERVALVEAKVLEQFRRGADELRGLQSKMTVNQIAKDRRAQLVERAQANEQKIKEEAHFAELWEQDRQKKIHREQKESAEQRAREVHTTKVLLDQLQQLKEKAQLEVQLNAEEGRLLRDSYAHDALLEERAKLEKEREQKALRFQLDLANKDKMSKQAAAVKKELDFDLAVLDEYLNQEKEEKASILRRKKEWNEEISSHRVHILEQRQTEVERDREIARLHKAEQDRVWALRAEKWKKEQGARDKLMQEVMTSRQQQLVERLARIRAEKEAATIEKDRLAKMVEQARAEHSEEEQDRLAKGQEYKDFLIFQIKDREDRLAAEEARIKKEEQAHLDLAERYTNQLKLEMERTVNGQK